MPNHVTNVLIVSPKVAQALTREHTAQEIAEHDQRQAQMAASYKARTGKDWPYENEKLPERFVDFELVVPSPPNKEEGGCNGQHDPGVVCWYSWNVENWGTKWGAYESRIEPVAGDLCRVQFDTAWSHPYPVIFALSAKFPEEVLVVEYADEDLGSNVGSYKVQGGGQPFDEHFPEYGDEALDMAARIKYGMTYAELRKEWDE